MVPPYVLIDNCALNWLYTDYGGKALTPKQVVRARANLERAADQDRLRVFFNTPLLEEIAGCWHQDLTRPKVPVLLGALSRLAKDRWLKAPVRLREYPQEMGRQLREARALGPVLRNQRFLESWRTHQALESIAANVDDVLVLSGDKAYRTKKKYAADERGRREEALQLGSAEERAEFIATWRRASIPERHAIIDDWTRTEVENHSKQWGLVADPSGWPAMLTFRSTWFERAYCLARLPEILAGAKIDGSDLYDAVYFWDAAYADILVTTDRVLLKRAEAVQAPGITTPKLRAVHLDEWLPEWLDG